MINVKAALRQVGVSRLAHFTPSKNLPHIIADGRIRSSKDLADNAAEYFSPTDRQRFDRHPEMVCCTFEYPNGYYLSDAKGKADYINYPDWTCLLIDVAVAERPGTLFSPCNGATGNGAYLAEGGQAVLDCFLPEFGRWTRRPGQHHPRAATDLQAEVQVPGPIDLSALRGIVVPSDTAAANEYGRLHTLGLDPSPYRWVIAPIFFSRNGLSQKLRFGGHIDESDWPALASQGGTP